MRRSLARVLEEDCSDPTRHSACCSRASSDDPTDAASARGARAAGADHRELGGCRGRAARRHRQDTGSGARRRRGSCCVRLATWQRDKVEDDAAPRQALIKALDFDPHRATRCWCCSSSSRRAPGANGSVATRSGVAPSCSSTTQQREELFRRAKELADAAATPRSAKSLLRELLGRDDCQPLGAGGADDAARSRGRLQGDLRASGPAQRAPAPSDALVRELRHKAAVIARDKLGDNDTGDRALRAACSKTSRPTRRHRGALRELYVATERWEDLGALARTPGRDGREPCGPQRSADRAGASQRRGFNAAGHGDRAACARVSYDDPGHADAVVALSELYEKTQRDEELAELLNSQIAAASERGDTEAELQVPGSPGRGLRSRLGDPAKAIETYRGVLEREREAPRRARGAGAPVPGRRPTTRAQPRRIEQLLDLSEGEEAVRLSLALADEFGSSATRRAPRARWSAASPPTSATRSCAVACAACTSRRRRWDKLAGYDRARTRTSRQATGREGPPPAEGGGHPLRQARRSRGAAAELLEKASELKPDDRELMLRPVRRLQRVGARQGRRRGAREDRRVLRRQALQGARRDPSAARAMRIWPTARRSARSRSSTRRSASSLATSTC